VGGPTKICHFNRILKFQEITNNDIVKVFELRLWAGMRLVVGEVLGWVNICTFYLIIKAGLFTYINTEPDSEVQSRTFNAAK
jgi:hypothetical protein